MSYSIITTCDEGYFPFLKILVNSVFKMCDESLLNNFIIVNTGLNKQQKEYLSNKSNKVSFIETGLNTSFKGGIWGDDWRINVKSKTSTLYETLKQLDHPLLMLDADMKVLKDLKHLINYGGDIQVCVRPSSIKYIGSYVFILNPKKSLSFIEYWRDLTNNSKEKKAMESPSLVVTVEKFKSHLDIVELPQELVNVISPDLLTDNSFLIHYKSKSLHKSIEETLKKRIWDGV
tara:strand:- start:767 stop:1462 length:696 start_codon:yes stop_codon:yes gene_type:complete